MCSVLALLTKCCFAGVPSDKFLSLIVQLLFTADPRYLSKSTKVPFVYHLNLATGVLKLTGEFQATLYCQKIWKGSINVEICFATLKVLESFYIKNFTKE